MKILFHLGHPAHYHLFKTSIKKLKDSHKIFILIKKKDILENLLIEENIAYLNILPDGRKDSKIGIAIGLLKGNYRMLSFCIKNRPDILVGTSPNITHVGKLLNIPSINFNEDDAVAVPFFAKLSYPFATEILTPTSCDNGKWNDKSIKYNSYHELAYLHPDIFTPTTKKISKYIDLTKPYFILRFASLKAHHDTGVSGLNDKLVEEIISILTPNGNVYITSEKEMNPKFEKYRLSVPLADIHHVLYYANMFIGDSQTMAAEAAVLGTPSVRFNDFVGKLNYLEELEKKYHLTIGVKTSDASHLINVIQNLLNEPKIKKNWATRRKEMLNEKINLAKLINWFLTNYPVSARIMKNNPDYQYKFK